MKRIFCLLFLLLLPTGCSDKPAPAWIAAGHKQLETFKQDFLTGRAPRITEIHFRNAVEEIKKGGDVDLLGKAWLTRMALQVAVLREPEEGDYVKIEAAETVPANRNFYRFLTGNAAAVDVLLLPKSYRPFWTALRNGDAVKAAAAITAIDDPLSRLIASGLCRPPRLGDGGDPPDRRGDRFAKRMEDGPAGLARTSEILLRSGGRYAEKASAIRSRIDLIL